MFGSKVVDLIVIFLISFLAVNRLLNGQVGLGIFLLVLLAINLFVLQMKIKQDRQYKKNHNN